MIPVQLTIKGLYSYQDQQVIDFSRLTEAHLFGIFGAVGGGKSSILEAISYALFGETERLNRQDDRSYNMMNLKSCELWIDFIFDSNNERYRFTVSGKRHKQKFDKISAFDRNAYIKKSNEWIPLASANAENVLGLSYKNFRRTIIIPQGKFEEFLQLKPKDRTIMVKELFGLQRFELMPRLGKLEQKNDEKRSHIQGQLAQIEAGDKKELKEGEIKLEQLFNTIHDHEKKSQTLQSELLATRKLQDLFERLNQAKTHQKELHARENEYKRLEKTIQDVQTCRMQFADLMQRIEESNSQQTQLSTQIDKKQEQLSQLESKKQTARENLERARKEFDNRDEIKEKTRDLQTILQLSTLVQKMLAVEKEIDKKRQHHEKLDSQKRSIEEKENSLYEQINSLESIQPDLQKLLELKQWHQKRDELEKQKQDLEEEKDNIQTRINGLLAKARDIAVPLDHVLPDFESLLEQLDQQRTKMRQKQKSLQNDYEDKLGLLKLDEFAQTLETGKRCPLCGSTEHPLKYNGAENQKNVQELAQSIDSLTDDLEQLDKQIERLGQSNTRYHLLLEQRQKLDHQWQHIETQHKHHSESFSGRTEQRDLETVETELQQAQKNQEKSQTLRQEHQRTRNQAEKTRQDAETAKQRLDQAEKELDQNTIQQQTLLSQLVHLDYETYRTKSIEWLSRKIQTGTERIQAMESELQQAEKYWQEIQEAMHRLTAALEADKNLAEQVKEKTNQLHSTLAERLEHSPFPSIASIKDILAMDIDINESGKELQHYQNTVYAAQQQVTELEEACQDKEYDPQAHKEQEALLEKFRQEIDEWRENAGAEKSRLHQMRKSIEKRDQLLKELEQLNHRRENMQTLRQLFKASGFVNYISSVYLQNLCSSANQRFHHLTRQNLSLVLGTDNSFKIRDFLNEGKLRSIKTLSGGQMFQAALCLALALAENLQQHHQTQHNFFFLDEGFGSQDRYSLQIVFDTLQSLQKENRIIGIISHVEELQQELDVFLSIQHDEEKGSRIKPSWELA